MRERYIGIGPVQARILAMLSEYADGNFATSIAERSPLGPRAVRVRPTGSSGAAASDACSDLARWLEDQTWVEAVTAHPPHVYLRVVTGVMRAWVAAGPAGRSLARGREGLGRSVVVRFPDANASSPRPLDLFRESAVGRAVAALLSSRGYEVRIDTIAAEIDAGAPQVRSREAGKMEPRTFDGGMSTPDVGGVVHAQVGGVDVPHGPLRARHGGTVSADDLIGELRNGREVGSGRGPGGGAVPGAWRDLYAEALLTFVLLRTERTRRIRLDEVKLHSESTAFDSVLAALRVAGAGSGHIGTADEMPAVGVDTGDTVRDLAIELELLAPVAARAASELEPAFLARYIRSLTDRTLAARPYLPPDDRLWPAVVDVIETAFELVGIGLPHLKGGTDDDTPE